MSYLNNVEYEDQREKFLLAAGQSVCQNGVPTIESLNVFQLGVILFLSGQPLLDILSKIEKSGYNWALENYYTYFPPEEGEEVIHIKVGDKFEIYSNGKGTYRACLPDGAGACAGIIENVDLSELRPVVS